MSAVPMFARRTGQTVEIIHVSPDLARKMLGFNVNNRNVRRSKVEQFARDMATGRWHLTGQGVSFAEDGELLDGQHRLLAVIASEVTVPMLVVRGVVKDAKESFDTGVNRTPADMLAITVPGTKNTAYVAAIARWVIAWDHGFRWVRNYGTTHAEMRAWVADPTNALIHRATEIATGSRKHVPVEPTIVGVAYFLCARIDVNAAEDFYVTKFIQSIGLTSGHPVGALRKRLTSGADADRKGSTAAFGKLAAIITAWNHYRAGTSISKIQTPRAGWSHKNYPEPR